MIKSRVSCFLDSRGIVTDVSEFYDILHSNIIDVIFKKDITNHFYSYLLGGSWCQNFDM